MKTILINKWTTGIVLALAAISFSAWKAGDNQTLTQKNGIEQISQDTSKPKKKSKIRYKEERDYTMSDIEKALKDLDKASVEIEQHLKIDMGKMEKEMKLAMEEIKKVDVDKIQAEVRKAMKEVELAMKEINLKEIDKEVNKELAKVKAELKSEKFKHEIIDAEKIKKEVEKGMEEAKSGIAEAKKQLTKVKNFVNELDKDGLIDKEKDYKIQVKDHKLYINGKAQSEEVNKKYSKYLDEDDYTISKNADDTDTEI